MRVFRSLRQAFIKPLNSTSNNAIRTQSIVWLGQSLDIFFHKNTASPIYRSVTVVTWRYF